MRCLIVHNSRSGFGSSAIYEFERALLSGGDECVLRLLADNQRADEAVVDAEDFDLVVVSGGDGTTTSYCMRYAIARSSPASSHQAPQTSFASI